MSFDSFERNSPFPRETMANRTTQVNQCLNKLYDLMPDGIITYEVIRFLTLIRGFSGFCLADLGLYNAVLDGINTIGSTRK